MGLHSHQHNAGAFHRLLKTRRRCFPINRSIVGLMIESHLKDGRQDYVDPPDILKISVSITDACLSFDETVEAIREFAGSC